MTDVIEVVQDVRLDAPLLVVALTGWVDAGTAGEGAVAYLETHLDQPVELANVDLADLADLQQSRPTVRLVDGVTRRLEWPRITFVAGKAGPDVVVCRGPEPSTRWRAFSAEVAAMARSLGVGMGVALGGMPAPVSHRRPVRVLATAGARSVAQEVEPLRPDYTGPTGAQTAVQVALAGVGIAAVGLWAQVPHYLAATVSSPAMRALLSRLREISGVGVDLGALDEQSEAYQRQVEETVSGRAELGRLVEQLDARIDDLPSGDELASEIEEFLRGER